MATTIKYTDTAGLELNGAQVQSIGNFYRETYENSIKKIVEYVEDGKVIITNYYLCPSETVASVLPQFQNIAIGFVIVSTENGYTIRTTKAYKKGILSSVVKSVSDGNGRILCFQKVDILTGLPYLECTEKSYYDVEGTEVYEFTYNADGSCFMIYNREEDEQILGCNIGQPGIDFSWLGFEYYQNAFPLTPTG